MIRASDSARLSRRLSPVCTRSSNHNRKNQASLPLRHLYIAAHLQAQALCRRPCGRSDSQGPQQLQQRGLVGLNHCLRQPHCGRVRLTNGMDMGLEPESARLAKHSNSSVRTGRTHKTCVTGSTSKSLAGRPPNRATARGKVMRSKKVHTIVVPYAAFKAGMDFHGYCSNDCRLV